MSAISLVGFNGKLMFIVVMAEKREISQQRSNSELSDEIKNSTFLRLSDTIVRVSYTSTKAQE
jgi:hypothetical protein